MANSRGADDQVDTNTEEDHEETGPSDQTSLAELVALTALGPGVRGVDGRVAINIGTVLVGESVDTIALALSTLRINPVLRFHGLGDTHQVALDGFVLDRVQSLLAEVYLLARGNDGGADGGTRTVMD